MPLILKKSTLYGIIPRVLCPKCDTEIFLFQTSPVTCKCGHTFPTVARFMLNSEVCRFSYHLNVGGFNGNIRNSRG